MIYQQLFLHEVKLYWKLEKINIEGLPTKLALNRIDKVIGALEIKSKQVGLPVQFLVSTFAYFCADICKLLSFNMIQLKLVEFYDKFNLEAFPKYTDSDVILAYDVRGCWFHLNRTIADDIPIRVRKFLAKQKVVIGGNSFFNRSFNFPTFCSIAKFVNENRLKYPEMHGLLEFFLHKPVLDGVKDYSVEAFLEPSNSMEKYYKMVYQTSAPEERYKKFLSLVQPGLDYSNFWCFEQLKKDLDKTSGL